MTLMLALLIGIIAGLRAMTVPAAIAWAAQLGWLDLSGSALSFLATPWVAWLATALALGELVTDQLPSTPSRKVPVQFTARLLVGALGGAAFGIAGGGVIPAIGAGVIGAFIGTTGGAWARGRLAALFGRDMPAAIIEDAVAIGGAYLIVSALP
jgi:uncharacterized membrane protein